MAIVNFIPEVWAAGLLGNLRDQLVFGQSGVINRDYEGEIAIAGDTVHITSFADPATRAYTKNGTITWDLLTDDTRALIVDQSDYFAFKVDDIDKRQAKPGFVEATTLGASYNLAADSDAYLAAQMVAAVSTNDLGGKNAVLVPDASATETTVYDLLVDFRTALTRSKTPNQGRWVVVPPEMYALLLKDDRFIRADAAGTTEGLRNGFVGRAAGFDVIESNTVPQAAGVHSVLAGHGMATTYAEQIASVKAVELENTFGDGVKGLHLYGAKVVREAQLALADVTIGPAA